jgi:uncharacterized membrane protein
MHAYWNLFVKQATDKLTFTWLFLLSSVLLYLPMAIFALPKTAIPPIGWYCIIGTSLTYCFYFVFLGQSYEDGDLSIAYPVARGIAPLLTVAWGTLFLQEQLSLLGSIGIGVIIMGVMLMHISRKEILSGRGLISRLVERSSLTAIATGVCSSVYSVIDKVGVTHVLPMAYVYLTFTGCTLLLLPVVVAMKGKNVIRREWRQAHLRIVTTGFLCLLGYMLILFAMSISKVSYVVPLRSVSVVLGVLLGTEVLGEGERTRKICAAVLIAAGTFTIAYYG